MKTPNGMNTEKPPVPLEELGRSIDEFLKVPSSDTKFTPMADDLIKALRTAFSSSEALQRYREVRDRMGLPHEEFIIPPNFPYTVHSA